MVQKRRKTKATQSDDDESLLDFLRFDNDVMTSLYKLGNIQNQFFAHRQSCKRLIKVIPGRNKYTEWHHSVMDAHGQMFQSAAIVISAFLTLVNKSSPEFISDDLLTVLVNQFNKLELDGLNCLIKLKGLLGIIENDDDSKHGVNDDTENDNEDEIGSVRSMYDYKFEDGYTSENTECTDGETGDWESESTDKDDLESVVECGSPNDNAQTMANKVRIDSDGDEVGYNGISIETGCQSEDMVDVKDDKDSENHEHFEGGVNAMVANKDSTEFQPEDQDEIQDVNDVEIGIITDEESEETHNESKQLNSERNNYAKGSVQRLTFSEAYHESNINKLPRDVRKRSQSPSRSGLKRYNGTQALAKRVKLQEISLPKIPKTNSNGLPDIIDAVKTGQLDLSYQILVMAAQIRQRDIKSKIKDLEKTLKETESEIKRTQKKYLRSLHAL